MTQQGPGPVEDGQPIVPFDFSSVPVAERPALQADDYIETEEQTIWLNPFNYPVAVKVHVGSSPMLGDLDDQARKQRWFAIPAPRRRELEKGIRTYVIPAKQMRALPSEFDMGIQRTECQDPGCVGRKLYCKNRDHTDKLIVGGDYPRLINKGTRRHPIKEPYRLHPALDEERARAAKALEDAKRRLEDARNAKELALVAHADLVDAQTDIAAAEARLTEARATEGVIAHQKQVIEALGNPNPNSNQKPKPTK